jgi:hemerythrin-like domain-containing protein
MRPTEILMHEHRVIEQVLDCLERMADRCESEGRLDGDSAREALDFFRNFADRCHHGKEEQRLFPAMEQRGFPADNGPVAVMRLEHEQGRQWIRGMDEAIAGAAVGEEQAVRQWLHHAHGYRNMLREHIQKEDHCLFPMADGALTSEDQRALAEAFDHVEHDEIGTGVHERYVALADTLAERLGVSKNRIPEAARHGCCSHTS